MLSLAQTVMCDTNQPDEGENSKNSPFYKKAQDYWSKIPATVDGMLGGFGFISQCDIEGSGKFLQSLTQLESGPGTERALDCGAGIGRVVEHLLTRIFETVDLVDQDPNFIDQAKKYVTSDRVGEFYCCGLQDFKPSQKYDLIWCQWVLGHLTDDHLVEFLKNCACGLKENGLIVVKENVTSSGETELDTVDSSVTRPYSSLLELFEKSNLELVKEAQQEKFPQGLYAVKMLALRPKCV